MNRKQEKTVRSGPAHLLSALAVNETAIATAEICRLQREIYGNIAPSQRISKGIVFSIKELAKKIAPILADASPVLRHRFLALYDRSEEMVVKAVVLRDLSMCSGLPVSEAMTLFIKAADDPDWRLREMAAIFFRTYIKRDAVSALAALDDLVMHDSPRVRRFAVETLRPVQENRWMHRQPKGPLSIVRRLFYEPDPYPRTAVGNLMSDLSKKNPDLIKSLVRDLVATGDKNAYWIATRACRNLVKTEPEKVLDLLHTDTYRYKQKVYTRHAGS